MNTDVAPLVTAQALGAWLDRHGPDEAVGLPVVSYECPLARYLRDATGRRWRVPGHTAHPLGPCPLPESIPLPPWANRFTYLVDIHGGPTINAQEARECLAQALFDTQTWTKEAE